MKLQNMCHFCSLNMDTSTTCEYPYWNIIGQADILPAIPYEEVSIKNCPDCGVCPGGFHHVGCRNEGCPNCDEKFHSSKCNCSGNRIQFPRELTPEEKSTNAATLAHVGLVRELLVQVVNRLKVRGQTHDQSKLSDPELPYFAKYTHLAAGVSYGSPEYSAFLEAMEPAIKHHYAANIHHPEHYPNGIEGMSLLDLIEMLCDWTASTKRYKNGDIRESLKVHVPRFGIRPQLEAIFLNTIAELEGEVRFNG